VKCPDCQHENVSDFPFCESCLEILPVRPESGLAFDLIDPTEESQEMEAVVVGPAFPWNPAYLPETLVGRTGALEALLEGWDDVRNTWTGRIHLLVGDFGLGKTQVAKALCERALKREPRARVVEVECPGPFRLWDSVLRGLFDISAHAPVEVAEGTLAAGLVDHLPGEAREVAAMLVELMTSSGRTADAEEYEARMSRASGALARFLAALAHEPLLIVVTGANRATRESLEIAGTIEAALKDKPVMIVLVGSDALPEALPGWNEFPVTRLQTLNDNDAARLVGHFMTGLGEAPKDLVARIVERGGGSPSAMKSLVQYLREAGAIRIEDGDWTLDETMAWELELPDDLEGVWLARINTLGDFDRKVLGDAAVVGRNFWTGALVAMRRVGTPPLPEVGETVADKSKKHVSRSLDKLDAWRFIEKKESDVAGEDAWSFRSDMHWQLALKLVPEAARPARHSVVWKWLRMVVGPDSPTHFTALAHHAELAANNPVAARYSWKAAGRARDEERHADAVELLEAAHRLVAQDDYPTRMSITLDLGDARANAGDASGALDAWHEVLHLAWQLVNRPAGAKALLRIGRTQTDRGDYDVARQHIEGAMRLFLQVGDVSGVAGACLAMGRMMWLAGRLDEARQSYEKCKALYGELEDQSGLAETAGAMASLAYDRGDLADAEAEFSRALELEREVGDDIGVAKTLNNLGAVWVSQGEHAKALKAWKEALDIARATGFRRLQATLVANMAEGLMTLGRNTEAATLFDQAATWAAEADDPRALADIWLNRATLAIRTEDWKSAESALAEAKSIAGRLGLPRIEAQVERELGDLALERTDRKADARERTHKRSVRHFRKSVQLYAAAGYELDAAASQERLAQALEKIDRAEEASGEREAAEARRAKLNLSADDDT